MLDKEKIKNIFSEFKKKTILLIGANGQIGWELERTLPVLGEVIALDFPAIDLTQPDQIRQQVREIRPDIIINAAAYTAVDKAEEEPELAMAINTKAPAILAEEAKKLNVALVHYSTDYVFDGTKGVPYTEKDISNPLNIYGRTKLEGDRAIQLTGVPHLILRTSWVYGNRGKNFMLTFQRLAGEKEEIYIVDDQVSSPTWCRMIAEATVQILAQGIKNLPEFLNEKGGLYHLSAGGRTSWFGFAGAILKYSYDGTKQKVQRLIPIPSSKYPTLAKRPACSLLSCETAFRAFGLCIPKWESSLKQLFGEKKNEKAS